MEKPKFLLLTLFQTFIVFYILNKVAIYNSGGFVRYSYLNSVLNYIDIFIFLIGYSYILYKWRKDNYFNRGYFYIFSICYILIFLFKDNLTQKIITLFLYKYIKYPEEIIFLLNYIFIPYIFSKSSYSILRKYSSKVADRFFHEQFLEKINLKEKKYIYLLIGLNLIFFIFLYLIKKEIFLLKIDKFVIYLSLIFIVNMMKDLERYILIISSYISFVAVYLFFILYI